MDAELDSIVIRFEVDSTDAVSQIYSVTEALSAFERAGNAIRNTRYTQLDKIKTAIDKLGSAKIDPGLADSLTELSASLHVLAGVPKLSDTVKSVLSLGGVKMPKDVVARMDTLTNALNQLTASGQNVAPLDSIKTSLDNLTGVSSLRGLANSLNLTATAVDMLANTDVSNLENVVNTLYRLKDVGRIQIFRYGSNKSSQQMEVKSGSNAEVAEETRDAGEAAEDSSTGFLELASAFGMSTSAGQSLSTVLEGVAGVIGVAIPEGVTTAIGIVMALVAVFKVLASVIAAVAKRIYSAITKIVSVIKKLNQMGQKVMNALLAPLKRIVAPLEKAKAGIERFLSMVKRVIAYRAIRGVLRAIIDGIKEGVENLYHWSRMNDGVFSASMDRAATAVQYFKNSVGAMTAPLINVLVPVLDAVIDKVVEFVNVINEAIARLTGAATWTKAVKKSAQYLDSASGSAKELKRTLIGIDQIHLLNGDSGGSGGGGGTDASGMFTTEAVTDAMSPFMQMLLESWDKYGGVLMEKVAKTKDDIVSLFSDVGKTFADSFVEGKGQNILDSILRTAIHIVTATDNIAVNLKTAWDWSNQGYSIASKVWDIVDKIQTTIESIAKATAEWTGRLNLINIVGSINTALGTLQTFVDFISTNLAWAWENVLLPLGKWVIEDTLPNSITVVSNAFGLLMDVLRPVIDGFKEAWDTMEFFRISIHDRLNKALSDLAQWFEDIKSKIPQEDLDKIKETASELARTVLLQLGFRLSEVVKYLEDFDSQDLTHILSGLADVIKTIDILATGIRVLFIALTSVAEMAYDVIAGVINLVQGDWTGAASHFGNALDTGLKGVGKVQSAWDKMQLRLDEIDKVEGAISTAVKHGVNDASKLKADFKESFSAIADESNETKNEIGEDLKAEMGAAQETSKGIIKAFTDSGKEICKQSGDTSKAIKKDSSGAASDVKKDFSGMQTSVTKNFGDMQKDSSTSLTKLETDSDTVYDNITNKFGQMPGKFSSIFSDVASSVTGAFSSQGSIGSKIVGGVSSVITTLINKLITAINNALDSIFTPLRDLISKFKSFTILGTQPFKNVTLPNVPKIALLASGGMLPSGAGLFVAGEKGPELVASASGGASAVMNNDQIVRSVAGGVAAANEYQNSLLREQNQLLRQLLSKQGTVRAYVTTTDIVSGLSDYNKRTGRQVVAMGG